MGYCKHQRVPDSCQMAVIVDNVKVRHSAVALLLAGLVFKVLQGHSLGESVNTQDFGRLGWDRQAPHYLIHTHGWNFSCVRRLFPSSPNCGCGVYLELVTLPTDTAGQARLLDQLLHLLQQWGLCHHLTLLISLKSKHIEPTLNRMTTRREQAHKSTVLLAPVVPSCPVSPEPFVSWP